MLFDGKTLTLLGKNANVYVQAESPGTVDQLVNDLQEKFKRPMPAADLLLTNSYDELTADVHRRQGSRQRRDRRRRMRPSGFPVQDVDFQIWIAQGDKPYPCRFSITSRSVPGGPQYSVQVRDWNTGTAVAATDFTFKNPGNANKVDIKDVREKFSDLPGNFKIAD